MQRHLSSLEDYWISIPTCVDEIKISLELAGLKEVGTSLAVGEMQRLMSVADKVNQQSKSESAVNKSSVSQSSKLHPRRDRDMMIDSPRHLWRLL